MNNKFLSIPFWIFAIISFWAFFSLWIGRDDAALQVPLLLFSLIFSWIALTIFKGKSPAHQRFAGLVGVAILLFLTMGAGILVIFAKNNLSTASCAPSDIEGLCKLGLAATIGVFGILLIIDVLVVPRLLRNFKNKG